MAIIMENHGTVSVRWRDNDFLITPTNVARWSLQIGGSEVQVLITAGDPSEIRPVADCNRIKANRNDLAFVKIEVIDENGRLVPRDLISVKLILSGNGELVASGNANPKDMASVNQPNLRNLQSVKRAF
jgi:hypothetical protein